MPEKHEGDVHLRHSFAQVHAWLQRVGPQELLSSGGSAFTAVAAVAESGSHASEKVIRFYQRRDGKPAEYARCYACCWEHYYNCNRTRIGMYTQPLDIAAD